MSAKQQFAATAAANGVTAGYSGNTGTMYVKGDDKKVKSFIRVVNLKGKGHYPFPVKQGQ
jgi:hypothetical protein